MPELITTDAARIPVKPANGRRFTLEEWQEIVGGDVETITLPDGKVMLMNEEGKYLGLPRNDIATLMAFNIQNDDVIVGNVLVYTEAEWLAECDED